MKNKIIILIIIIASPLIQTFGQCTSNSGANAPTPAEAFCSPIEPAPDIPSRDLVPRQEQPDNGPQEGCPLGDPFLEIEKYNLWTGEELTLTIPEGHFNKLFIDGNLINNTLPYTFSRDEVGTFLISYELDNGPDCKTQGKICIIVAEGIYVTKKIKCDQTRENYQVMLSVSGEDLGQGYIVTDNETGIVFGPATNPVITLPTREVPMGYSYTVSLISNPECEVIEEESMVDCTTTAIELTLFNGSVETKGNQLRWQTASEINVENFIVEKSNNGIDFEEMKKVKAKGNSNSNNSYTTMDLETKPGIYYYRLLEENFNRKQEIVSEVIRLERKASETRTLSIVPNPASDHIFIQFNNDKNINAHLKIINSIGQIMKERVLTIDEKESGQVQLNIMDFPAGIYYIDLNQAGVEMQGKFVKY